MARRGGIRRADVVEAAGDDADREGLSSASLTAVADPVGIRTRSVYANVQGLGGLRPGVAADAAARLAVTTGPGRPARAGDHPGRAGTTGLCAGGLRGGGGGGLRDAGAAYNVLVMGGRLHRRLLLMLLGLSALALSITEDLGTAEPGPPQRAVPALLFLRTVRRFPPGARRVLLRAAVRGWGLVTSALTVLTCGLLLAAALPLDAPSRSAFAYGAWTSTLVALYACWAWLARRRADFDRSTGRAPRWRYQRRR